jgi:hypothetical protein
MKFLEDRPFADAAAAERKCIALYSPVLVVSHSASLAGQAMNRYRGTQAEFQFSIVAPHTAHSKLLISRASAMCSLRS